MSPTRRRARLGLGLGMAVPGLVACASAPPVPAAFDEPERHPSASRDADIRAAGQWGAPRDARGTGSAAREAFVHHAVDVLNHTARTLDASALRTISAPRCLPCKSVASYVEGIGRRGGRIEGGAWRVVDLIAMTTGSDRFRQVNVAVGYGPQTVQEGDGARSLHYDAGKTLFTFDIGRRGGRWVILSIRGPQP